MALLQINLSPDAVSGLAVLDGSLRRLPKGTPVTLMIHGYRFSPDNPLRSPHEHILSLERRACWKAVSWPRHLHLHRKSAGLGLALGWPAIGGLPTVAARAFEAGAALAGILDRIHTTRPDLPVGVLCHSLGARVALNALSQVQPGAVRRLILMSGAEYRSTARAAMASPAGRQAQVLNMCSRENALFDGLFRLCVPAPVFADRALSAGLPDVPGWTDLRIDCPEHRAALRRFGIRTPAPVTRICHWSTYLRPGLFKLYRQVLDPATPELLPRLAAALPSGPQCSPLPAAAPRPMLPG